MPSWKKVIVSGSDALLNTLTVTNGITGSLHGTASWAENAITSSYALNAVSASHAVTASYAINADFLDGKDSSVFATTGSNIFVGNQTVTGSLFTTGSNTLIGTTSLTGSLNISGSETITGYIQFEPVTTNINPAISASYIYVSGSTSDLYFSQNGEGYSNTTRLRWLEGNLYTGLLNGGLITTQSSTVYQISSGSGIIVDLNASLNDNPYPTIQYLNWGNLSASIAPLTASYQQAFVSIDSTGNIYQQGTPYTAGQFSTEINIGIVLFQNQSTINGVKTQPSVAYGFEQQQNIFNRAFGPLKLSGYTLAPSGSSTGSLIVASGTAYAPGSNYTVDPNEPSYAIDPGTNASKIFRYHQSGSTWVYNTNGGPGFATIDPTRYSNNGVLTSIPSPNSNWTIQRVFYFPNSVTKAIVVYYGNQIYGTEADAIANLQFETFVEAPNTAANAVYLGAIVIKGTGVFTNPTDYKILAGGLFRQVGGSGGGGSIVTQTLSGLSDVNISGPIDGQALVYNTTQAKWINSSAISASITGNAATATTASYALTSSNVQGGDQYYIPLWNTDTSLTSSYLYQNNDTLKTFDFGISKGLTLSFLNDEYFLGNTSSSYSGSGTWINVDSGDGVTVISSDNYTLVNDKLGVGMTPTNKGLAVSGSLEVIQGNILLSGSPFPSIYSNEPAHTVLLGMSDDTSIYGSYFRTFGNQFLGPQRGSAEAVYDIRNSGSAGFHVFSYDGNNFHRKFLVDDTGSYITGSLVVTDGITGSLHGTASWAENAISSSYADSALSSSYAVTASYVEIFPYTGSAVITGSLLVTGSVKSTTVQSNIFINNQTITDTIYVPSGSNALIIGPVDISEEIVVEGGGNLYITDFTNPTPNLQAVTDVGSTTTNSITAANFITTSDKRLKSEIKAIKNPFKVLDSIKSYEYIKDGKKDAGFLAQEVQETIPYAVFENEEGMLTMSDRPLLAYLYAAVMELKEENKKLKKELKSIKP